MCAFTIEKADNADQEDIFTLVDTVLREYGLKTDLENTDKDLSDLDNYYFNNNGWFGVIRDKGKAVIGSYGLIKIDDHTCELRKMYLYPEYQGKGLGKKMMDHAVHKAAQLGYRKITLETNRVLNKAIGLYTKYGFEVYRPEHLSERCDLTMRKSLK